MKTYSFHIGNYLKEMAEKKRWSVTNLSKELHKSRTGITKDFEKPTLHMDVIESYANLFGINIYNLLAEIWKKEHEGHSEDIPMIVMEDSEPYEKSVKNKQTETVSVSFQIDSDKKEQLLKLLTS